MANFFYAKAEYADGHTETFEGVLWYLDGTKNEENHNLLAKLRADEAAGIITRLFVDYES